MQFIRAMPTKSRWATPSSLQTAAPSVEKITGHRQQGAAGHDLAAAQNLDVVTDQVGGIHGYQTSKSKTVMVNDVNVT